MALLVGSWRNGALVIGPTAELEEARKQILVLDRQALFDPKTGCYVVQEGDEMAILPGRRFGVGTKHFVCLTGLSVSQLQEQISAKVEFCSQK